MKLFLGHDPSVSLQGFEGEGVDLLLTVWDGEGERGALELAVRPGKDRRDRTWAPPALLWHEPVSS